MTIIATTPIDPKRLERARAISMTGGVTSIDATTWHVASQTGSGYHLVTSSGPEGLSDLSCSCEDWAKRNCQELGLLAACKHSAAVAMEEGFIEGPPPPPVAPIVGDDDEDDFAVEFEEVTDRLQADGTLWQLSRLEDELREVEDLATREIEQIQRWRVGESRRLKGRMELFSSSLEAYLKREQRKSLRLPHGEIKLRKAPDKLIVDEDIFDLNQEDFVRIVPEQRKPDIAKMKKHLKATGELLPGVDLEIGEVKFSATCKTADKEV